MRAFAPLAFAVFFLTGACGALLPNAAAAQVTPPAPMVGSTTLREALDAAWALSPQRRAGASRQAELQAREAAAAGWFAGSPSANLVHRSDRVGANAGLREYEAEVAVPLWGSGVQAATRTQAGAERDAYVQQHAQARLRLAGEVRQSAAELAMAQVDQALAVRKRDEAAVLTADVERRVEAGESARVDALLAQSALRVAEAALAQAASGLLGAQSAWRALTGLAEVPELEAEEMKLAQGPAGGREGHPSLLAAQALARLAQARLGLAERDRRDPVELGVGLTRERAAFGAAPETSLRVALRIPFATDARNAPRIALARAELDAAQAEADAAVRQVDAQVAAARAALEAARRSETLARERAELVGQAHALVANSWRLGNDGLPARLRAEADKSDADLALARARIATRRAVSQLNQALGLLP